MRVLFVVPVVFGSKKGGGERYITELARALRKCHVDVDLVVVNSLSSFCEQPDFDSIPSPISFVRFLQIVRKADITHVHQLNSPGFDFAALAKLLLGVPLVLTDHGGGVLTPARALGRLRLRLIDAAGYVSQWSRHDLDPHGVIKLSRVIFGGGDHLPEGKPLPDRYDFGFVGRLLPHKGAHIAVEALPPGASLIVAGQVRDEAYHIELQRLSKGKNVKYAPDASDSYLAALLRSVRYLLVPSVESYREMTYVRPELLGLVALEALAAGTPVIGSDVGGLGELLRVANQQALPPGDIAAWRDGLAKAFVEPCKPFSAKQFTWNEVAAKCLDLYQSVLNGTVSNGGGDR